MSYILQRLTNIYNSNVCQDSRKRSALYFHLSPSLNSTLNMRAVPQMWIWIQKTGGAHQLWITTAFKMAVMVILVKINCSWLDLLATEYLLKHWGNAFLTTVLQFLTGSIHLHIIGSMREPLCALCIRTDCAETLGKYITHTSQILGLLAKMDFAVPLTAALKMIP